MSRLDIPFMIHCALRWNLSQKNYDKVKEIFEKWHKYMLVKDMHCFAEDLIFYSAADPTLIDLPIHYPAGEQKMETIYKDGIIDVYMDASFYAIGRLTYVTGDWQEWTERYFKILNPIQKNIIMKRLEDYGKARVWVNMYEDLKRGFFLI